MRSFLLCTLVACDLVAPVPAGEPRQHPCIGSRTDALWMDDTGVYVGCGQNAEGYGLFHSTDSGQTWDPHPDFETFRVTHITRAGDDQLYVSGTEVGGPDRVRRVTSQGVERVLVAANQIWNTFTVGTYIRQDNGFQVSESLTGAGLSFRLSDTDAWEDGSGWTTGSYQMSDGLDVDDRIVGVGSTIAQPPTIFVQQQDAFFQAIELQTLFTGELWAVDHDAGLWAAVGVDQDADDAVYFLNRGDPTVAAAWVEGRLDDTAGDPTWFWDVCVTGQEIVLVGSHSRRDAGLLRRSTDGGETFSFVTLPEDTPSLHRCVMHDGRTFVAGANGFFLEI